MKERTFQSSGLVDGKVSVPDDGEIHRQVPHLITFIPVLQEINRHNKTLCESSSKALLYTLMLSKDS